MQPVSLKRKERRYGGKKGNRKERKKIRKEKKKIRKKGMYLFSQNSCSQKTKDRVGGTMSCVYKLHIYIDAWCITDRPNDSIIPHNTWHAQLLRQQLSGILWQSFCTHCCIKVPLPLITTALVAGKNHDCVSQSQNASISNVGREQKCGHFHSGHSNCGHCHILPLDIRRI